MKKIYIFGIAFFIALFSVPALCAQSLKGMSLSGSTGLVSVPTGRIAWERSSDFGIDFGYHTVVKGGSATHIPKASLSLFKWVEISSAFDIQPENHRTTEDGTDFIGGLKIQFPLESSALALGGNLQVLNMGHDSNQYNAGQIYAAVTYAGHFFNMPAETTIVLGKSFHENHSDSNIDFGMGFDLVLLPHIFNNFIHWITDFANFSYSAEAFGADSTIRGVLNTGVRIDLSSIPALSRFKFVVDILMTDAFDDQRAFSAGLVFGVPVL